MIVTQDVQYTRDLGRNVTQVKFSNDSGWVYTENRSYARGYQITGFTATAAGVDIFGYTRFDVAPDGRFVMVQEIKEEGVEPSLVLVRNWLLEFKKQD